MRITADPGVSAVPGSFGELSEDGRQLRAAPELTAALRRLGARTAESLYDQASASPSFVAQLLGWTQQDVLRAVANLRSELARTHPELFESENSEAQKHGYGALPPRAD